MTREELIAYDRWLTENKWGSSEIITPEQAADLYLAKHPLSPAEGAEKSCLSCRFHNSPTYHDKMWCRDCQQLSHYEQQPTAEGAGKTCHAKEMEYNHNMCAMQESCEKCEAYKVPTNEGDIAKTETDTGRIVDMPDLSQPTAEGAEEIEAELRGYARDIVRLHKPIMEVNPQLAMDSIGNDLVKMFNRLAQRIADKMVEKKSPSNEQIHEAALAWARDHSEAPDKDCPDWLIRDYEAGAYFVRQCYGCLNKTDNLKIRER